MIVMILLCLIEEKGPCHALKQKCCPSAEYEKMEEGNNSEGGEGEKQKIYRNSPIVYGTVKKDDGTLKEDVVVVVVKANTFK